MFFLYLSLKPTVTCREHVPNPTGCGVDLNNDEHSIVTVSKDRAGATDDGEPTSFKLIPFVLYPIRL